MELHLAEDIFNVDKYLLNGVDFDLKLYLTQPSFMLMSDDSSKEYRVIIEKAIFKAMMVDVGSKIESANSKSMEKRITEYFFQKTAVKSCTLAHLDNVFKGNLPDKMVIAFVSAK